MQCSKHVPALWAGFLLANLCLANNGTPVFAPLESWRAAVVAGDASALARLYSSNPPAQAYVAKTRVAKLSDEWQYWAGLKTAGITSFDPKVLAINQQPNQATLVLRISAVKGSEAAVGGAQNFVASMQQIWVRQPDGWRIALSQRFDFHPDAGRRLPEPAKPNPALYPSPGDAQTELKTASAEAARDHKRILVIFGANWCYDCHVLDATFHSKDFAPLLAANYIVVHINTGDEGKDNNDLAARFGVNLDHGIPSLAVLDPDGHVVVAQQNGEFESTVKIGPDDVKAFLKKWAPARKTSG
ncbi:MAG TPA: thioredoxin family protein [Bryobacteraceae bacterium]|jgi:ketosteroid isomerase-like protein|nr:thioredoxin family protein [Bryobacteraceae bacterium]